uniref:DUF4537 domain-containing protein n=1 Tax=Macrostomum lignano TaxID=282301 RepID=A0A1I8JQ58_9PLAT
TLAPHQILALKWLANPGCAGAGQPEAHPAISHRYRPRPFGRQVWQAEMRATRPDSSGPRQRPQSARRPPPDPSLLPYWCYTEGRRAPPYFPAEPPGLPAVRADASWCRRWLRPRNAAVPSTRLGQRVPTGQAHPHPARPAGHRLHFGLFYPGCAACTRPRCTFVAPRSLRQRPRPRLLAVSSAAAAPRPPISPQLLPRPRLGPGQSARQMSPTGRTPWPRLCFTGRAAVRLSRASRVLVWLEDAEDRAAFPPPIALCPRADPLVFVACRDRLLKVQSSGTRGVHGPERELQARPLRWTSLRHCSKAWFVPLAHRAPCLVRQAILNWSARRRLHMAYAASGHGKSSTGSSPDPGEPFPHTNPAAQDPGDSAQ